MSRILCRLAFLSLLGAAIPGCGGGDAKDKFKGQEKPVPAQGAPAPAPK